ncbi:MAG: hypothetical protein MK052_05910 [Alphaproteobacteria bacterium]|nr:hypothetical protein [Alphaproteobacteria bacterium]
MADPKAQYEGYTGIPSLCTHQQIKETAEEKLSSAVIKELADIIGLKQEAAENFRNALMNACVSYMVAKAVRPPTSGQSNNAIQEVSKLSEQLFSKLEKADINTRTWIFHQLGELPPEPFEPETIFKSYEAGRSITHMRGEIVSGYLEMLRDALSSPSSEKFPRKNGPNKGDIRTYVAELCQIANTHASINLEIKLSKEPQEALRGSLAMYLGVVLTATISKNYTSKLSLGEIHKTARKAIP